MWFESVVCTECSFISRYCGFEAPFTRIYCGFRNVLFAVLSVSVCSLLHLGVRDYGLL